MHFAGNTFGKTTDAARGTVRSQQLRRQSCEDAFFARRRQQHIFPPGQFMHRQMTIAATAFLFDEDDRPSALAITPPGKTIGSQHIKISAAVADWSRWLSVDFMAQVVCEINRRLLLEYIATNTTMSISDFAAMSLPPMAVTTRRFVGAVKS